MIYHITKRDDWEQAQQNGAYTAASLDSEGFIHCSTREQITKVANAFYRGQGNLLILCIDAAQLTSELKWEAPAHPNPDHAPDTHATEQFPHVYGTIGLQAVADVIDFPEGADGFTLPHALP